MRVFIALPLTDGFKRILQDASPKPTAGRSGHAVRLRPVRPEGMHVTLAFLGELEKAAVEATVRAARSAVASVAGTVAPGPFELVSSGLITFPPRGKATVIAAGIGQGGAEATALANAIETALEAAGSASGTPFRPRETRPYTPHITLARADRPGVTLSGSERAVRFEARCIVDRLIVYMSVLERGGARYEPIEEIRFDS